MAEGTNILTGILAIILGIFIIVFPLFSIFTLSILTGIGIIFIGIWLLAMSYDLWTDSKGMSVISLTLGILGIILGIILIGKIEAFSILTALLIYVGGFFLIIAGIVALVSGEGPLGRGTGILGVIFGIIFLLVGIFALDPIYLAFLIGIFLLITGIFQIIAPNEK